MCTPCSLCSRRTLIARYGRSVTSPARSVPRRAWPRSCRGLSRGSTERRGCGELEQHCVLCRSVKGERRASEWARMNEQPPLLDVETLAVRARPSLVNVATLLPLTWWCYRSEGGLAASRQPRFNTYTPARPFVRSSACYNAPTYVRTKPVGSSTPLATVWHALRPSQANFAICLLISLYNNSGICIHKWFSLCVLCKLNTTIFWPCIYIHVYKSEMFYQLYQIC